MVVYSVYRSSSKITTVIMICFNITTTDSVTGIVPFWIQTEQHFQHHSYFVENSDCLWYLPLLVLLQWKNRNFLYNADIGYKVLYKFVKDALIVLVMFCCWDGHVARGILRLIWCPHCLPSTLRPLPALALCNVWPTGNVGIIWLSSKRQEDHFV